MPRRAAASDPDFASRAVVCAAVALAALPLAGAMHAQQPDNGGSATLGFTHKGGNEWWVEVRVPLMSGLRVESRDDGGPWVALTLRDWGNWAASYHIEPGHRVQFRATQGTTWDAPQWTSCWFTHPQGQEQCGAPSAFDATFSGVRGNEWWIQAHVAANEAIARVEVRLDGGAWQPLPRQSWGGYAASYHAVQGTVVQFQATSTMGGTDVSDCHDWVPPSNQDASKAPCGLAPDPTPFSVSYANVKGNAWWIEATATGSHPIAGVDARVDGGTWVPMQKRSWGAWAVSTHAPEGSIVQLRARATDGAYGFVPNGWVWTTAAPYPATLAWADFHASFHNVKGHAGWIQANAYSRPDQPLERVEARVDAGAWRALAQQPYGDWAAAVPVPAGALVELRACFEGLCDSSGAFAWPPAPAPAWPTDGSYAVFHVRHGSGSPGGDFWEEFEGNVTFRHDAGAWRVECDGVRHHFDNWQGFDNHTYTPVRETGSFAPPQWPTDARPNQELDGHVVVACGLADYHTKVLDTWSSPASVGGVPGDVPAWHAYYEPCPCAGYEAAWAQKTGLLLAWSQGGRGSSMTGHLVDTDAPLH